MVEATKSHLHVFSEHEATKSATDLLAYSGAFLPEGDTVFQGVLYERLLALAVSFAVNARRCLEIEGRSGIKISERRWNYRDSQYGPPLDSLDYAMNGIVHAKSLDVHCQAGVSEAYADMRTVQVHCFSFETAHHGRQTVDVFGMVWAFLKREDRPTATVRKLKAVEG